MDELTQDFVVEVRKIAVIEVDSIPSILRYKYQKRALRNFHRNITVSYTHLTLPTKRIV